MTAEKAARGPLAPGPLALALLAALAFAAYSPSLSGEFLTDDNGNILYNPALRDPVRWPAFLVDASAASATPALLGQIYRPLTTLSLAVNARLAGDPFLPGGLNPFWFHLVDVCLHALVTCLVFLLARRLKLSVLASFAAASLFCLHPAQVESVAYISGARPNGLALMLCLLSLLSYRQAQEPFSWGCFALGLMSKETAACFPLLLIAYDLSPGPREPWKARARRWAPYLLIDAAYLLLRRAVLGQVAQRGPWGGSWPAHSQLAVHGLFQDLRIALWPAHVRACYGVVQGEAFAASSALMLAGMLGLAALALYGVKRRTLWGFAAAWFVAGLLPVANIIPIAAFAADRFLYFPLVGSGIFWGFAVEKLHRTPSAGHVAGGLAVAGMVLALLPLNMTRQLDWQDEFVLDSADYATAPEDPCASLALVTHYFDWGMLGRARALAAQALAPGTPREFRLAGLEKTALALMKGGMNGEAVPYLDEALRLAPSARELHQYRGLCALGLGDRERAAREARLAESLPLQSTF